MARKRSFDDHGDEALVGYTRAGDTEAFGVLWQRHAAAGGAAARQFASIADPDDIVAEAYLRILRATLNGGGPTEAFRPYLYRTIRNVALDWREKAASVSLEVTSELEDITGNNDPETAVQDRTITLSAFRTLPERWQAVLWYLEVEGLDPAEAAPLLGLSPNAVSALAVRAREGLKRAWLQAHISANVVPPECQWTTERMGQYARGSLTPRARGRFDRHLAGCERCSGLVDEIDPLDGWLAGILLPLALGGTAGAGLLSLIHPDGAASASGLPSGSASGSTSAAPSAAGRLALSRRALVTAGAVIAVVAIGSGALAATWQAGQQPATAPGADAAASVTPSPNSAQTLSPSATPQPTDEPITPELPPLPSLPTAPAAPPKPAPDLTAPAVPLLAGPADGTLTNNPTPVFSGTGEPGARVDVQRSDPVSGALSTIASTLVDTAGRWAAAPPSALPDGSYLIRTSQVDRAGNRSAGDVRTLVIDTVADAPQLDPLPAGSMIFLPVIGGSAEPGASVSLRDDLGSIVGMTVAAGDGRWAIPLPDPGRDGATMSSVQTDLAGNTSSWSAATSPLTFDRPAIAAPASGATIASTSGATVVQVELAGHAGMQVEVLVDGVATGNLHTLDTTPIVRVTMPLADGAHTIGVRYVDPATAARGSTLTIPFVIAP